MMTITLTQGLVALVDDEDFDFLSKWKWTASREGRDTKFYAVRFSRVGEQDGGPRFKIRMAHVVYTRKTGLPVPEGLVVDHDNDDGLDNRRENLKAMTQKENMEKVPGWDRKGVYPSVIAAITLDEIDF